MHPRLDPLRSEVARWAEDPEHFARRVCGIRHIWSKQVEILEAVRDHPRVAVAACHESSKTFTASIIAWWFALTYGSERGSCKVLAIAPGGRQAEEVIGGEIRARHAGICRGLSADTIPTPRRNAWRMDPERWPNWWMQWFATSPDQATDHATKITGYHADHLMMIFEEAAGIPRVIWDSAEGNVTGGHTRWLAIGNPTDPSGRFAEVYSSPYWHSIRIDALEHPNVIERRQVLPFGVTHEWCERKLAEWGEDSPLYQSKVRGMFPRTADDTLIGIADVEAARARSAPAKQPESEMRWPGVGCDVARFGSDRTVIVVERCGVLDHVESFAGQDTMKTAGAVLRIASAVGLGPSRAKRIAIDDTGVGGGVTDRLREQGWDVRAENFGEVAQVHEHCYRRNMELWWNMRQWVQDEAALASLDPGTFSALMADLVAPKYKQRSDGTIELEPKKDVKKRIGRSPDYADAVALAVSWRLVRDHWDTIATGRTLPKVDHKIRSTFGPREVAGRGPRRRFAW